MLKRKTLAALTASIAMAFAVSAAQAATITWAFSDPIAFGPNLGAGSPVTSNDFGAGVTASNWTAVSPVRELGVAGGQLRAKKSTDTDTHTFSITIPNLVGQTITLTSIIFDSGEVGGDAGGPIITFSSNLGGGSSIGNPGQFPILIPDNGTVLNTVVPLNNYTGLNNQTITFTMTDAVQGNNKNETLYTWYDNVRLTGEVINDQPQIPEPASVFMGLAGLALIALRRRA